MFQISYNEQSEVLLSYNSTSHIQKMECDAPETHKISWNSVPVCKVVCAFPYILAFTPVAIEFRYAVNGSLLQTLAMPELRLISAKVSNTYLFCIITLAIQLYWSSHIIIIDNEDYDFSLIFL